MKKIIVFGASGDTGRYFIDYLLTITKSMIFLLLEKDPSLPFLISMKM
mgnify:CR=1 FL=1